MKKNNYTEMCYWNMNSYGNAIRIHKYKLHICNMFLAVIIPFVYPLPLAVFINRFIIKKDIIYRYEKK